MIQAANRLAKYSGQGLNKPRSLVVAPTGVAAYIIHGNTIDSALAIKPQNKRTFKPNTASRNSSLRFMYEDLKVLILDEVSMCGNAKFTVMNYRLQEIMGNSLFMGGISVVCTGDFGQLPPVGDSMIWQNSYLDGRIDIAPNHWDEHFHIYFLTQKMRSQDEVFSKISDKVRLGICDQEVQKYMENCVKTCNNEFNNEKYGQGKISIIVRTNEERREINIAMLNRLLPQEKEFQVQSKDESTNVRNAPKLFEKMPLTKTGQLENQFIFRKGAPIMVTSNHEKLRYKNNGIVNGSRGFIDSVQMSSENPDEIEIVWVVFNDENTGKLLREDQRALLKRHKPNNPLAVPIRKQKKQFSMTGNANWLREQFPLTLCYAITVHKSQGQTLEEVIIDFSGKPKSGMKKEGAFYTAMSRVRSGQDLYLRDFSPDYIKAHDFVETKLKAMKICSPYNFKKICLDIPIFKDPEDELKIGYININSVLEGQSDELLNQDENLLALDFLVVADTRLTKKTKTEQLCGKFSNWRILKRFDADDGIDHMGLMLLSSSKSKKEKLIVNLFKKQWQKPKGSKNMICAQLLSVKFTNGHQVGFIYIRETPTFSDAERIAKDLTHLDIIMGDLNLNTNKDEDKKKLDKLISMDKERVLHEITTNSNNQLDHILISKDLKQDHYCTSFNNFTTDHRVITIRLAKEGNNLSDKFHNMINFNRDLHTKVPHQDNPLSLGRPCEMKTIKRKIDNDVNVAPKKKRNQFRSFRNPDMESCWLNCCMQLMLCAFDHMSNQDAEDKSDFWKVLWNMKEVENCSLNPMPVRDILIQRERQRIVEESVVPQNRLFHFAGTHTTDMISLQSISESSRIGQQDCKDFFLSLWENRHYWPDVCSLFNISLLKFTTCLSCGQDSIPNSHSEPFLFLDCPQEDMNMNEFVNLQLNEPTLVDWKDEDGCGKKTTGNRFQRLRNLDNQEFIILIVQRLNQDQGGPLTINNTGLQVTPTIDLKKTENNFVQFEPIAVIHHDGYVFGNDTRGHYMADILDKSTNQWMRTSDDAEPEVIESVSRQGYIFLYRRSNV